MLNWLKWKIARREMEELWRWKVEWDSHRRRFVDFPNVARVLDRMKARVLDRPTDGVSTTRNAMRQEPRGAKMQINDKVRVLSGASEWMRARKYWMNGMPDSIDGLVGVVRADYTNLPGDDAHYGIVFDGDLEVGVNPQWLTAA